MEKVVNAIILDKRREKVLLIKRCEGIHSGKWAFPGGIVEGGESKESALKREIKEELGVKLVKILKKIGKYEYLRENGEKTSGESFAVSIGDEKIDVNRTEIEEFKWVKIEEIESLDCAPGIEEEAMQAIYGE